MKVPELTLDNLTWNDLVDLARRAIPAASEGTWTLHSPVDPGVTLVELFAAQLEQRLFMLDRVPDTLVRAVMRLLLGPDAGPRPAVSATAVLSLDSRSGAVGVRSGTELARNLDGERVVLTTVHSSVAVPEAAVTEFVVAGIDRMPQLRAGAPVPIFGRDGQAQAQLQITAEASAAEHLLYVAVEVPRGDQRWRVGQDPPAPAGTRPASPAAGIGWIDDDGRQALVDGQGLLVAPDRLTAFAASGEPAVRWKALVGDARWPLTVADGTAEFRVSGIVRLRPPPGRMFPPVFGLEVSTAAPDGALVPWVSAVSLNAVVARHRRCVHNVIPVPDSLAKPDREIALPEAAPHVDHPLDRVIDDPELVSVSARTPSGEETWTAVADLAFSDADRRDVEVDRQAGVLRFGDGTAGRIPRWPRESRLEVTYWVGAGTTPETGPGTEFAGPTDPALSARTVTRLSWGRETEAAAAARARLAAELAAASRAVTAPDISAILMTVPGVPIARVHVEPGWDPTNPDVLVPDAVTAFCVPRVERRGTDDFSAVPAPELDDRSRSALAATLGRARLVGSLLRVRGPAYRPVSVRVELVPRTRDRAGVDRAVDLTVRHFLDPLVGGADGKGWPFGEPLAPPAITAVLQQVLGQRADVLRAAVDDARRNTLTDCHPLALRAYELPAVRDVSIVPATAGRS